ncbi:MAG TPA: DUF4097 family beta strand repeat-containing protein [Candidatus Polarisedimenticolia bacterium]|nr:DUF4097 family beta strand repeat-containing protein [Candidatus Polarisedimenticolia bacterium]
MHRNRLFLRLALIALSIPTTPVAAAEVTRTIRMELSTQAAHAFAVENLAGTMRVATGNGDKVVAVATVHAESGSLAGKMRFEQVTGEKGLPTLRVIYPLGQHETVRYRQSRAHGDGGGFLEGLFGGYSSVKYAGKTVRVSDSSGVLMYADVEVQIPERGAKGTFRNLVGKIRGSRLNGDLLFDSASGDIDLDGVEGDVRSDTGSGNVKASGIKGTFRCDTGSGDCALTGFQGEEIRCDVGSGDIRLKSLEARRISADTGSGNVRAEHADVETFDADTGSGDVLLEAVGSRLARINADTGSGDVVIRMDPKASFEALADQGSGEMTVGYKDARPILKGREVVGYRRGESKIRINVSTGSGDLDIQPSH